MLRRMLACLAVLGLVFAPLAPLAAQAPQKMTVPVAAAYDTPTTVTVQPGAPQGSILSLGQAFGWLEPYVDSGVAALILAVLGKLGLDKNAANGRVTDADHRDTLEQFLINQASSLVADGFVRLNGLKVDVHSPALAAAAGTAFQWIPDAVKNFGLTPETLEAKIVDKIAHLPSVSAAQAQVMAQQAAPQAAPQPALPVG